MPLKLNVGVSKKIGQPNYGSLGASCHVEVELDGSLLVHDLEAFHRHVKNAFVACQQAVQDELTRRYHAGVSEMPFNRSRENDESVQGPVAKNGSGGNGLGPSDSPASERQFQYARQLAGQVRGLGVLRLDALAQRMFDKPLMALSTSDASGLIGTLKDIKAGVMDVEEALNGAAV